MSKSTNPQNIQLAQRAVLGLLSSDIDSAKIVGDTIEVTKANGDVIPVDDAIVNRQILKAWLKD